jgi:hypothetical protein
MKFIFKRHKTNKKKQITSEHPKTFHIFIHTPFLDKTTTTHPINEQHKQLGVPYMQNRDDKLYNKICSSVHIKIHKIEYFQQVMISVGPYSS